MYSKWFNYSRMTPWVLVPMGQCAGPSVTSYSVLLSCSIQYSSKCKPQIQAKNTDTPSEDSKKSVNFSVVSTTPILCSTWGPIVILKLMHQFFSWSSWTRVSPTSWSHHLGDLPYHTQVNLSYDIAQALAFLHSNGIIHCDLSSNNVITTS